MPIEIINLDALNPDEVAQNLAEMTQRVQESNPTLDLKRGVLHDLLVYLSAVLGTRSQADLTRYLSARSILDIENDPTLADSDVVERALSNWRLKRGDGSNARGEVTIVLSGPFSVTIGSGAIFIADGKQFTSDDAYTAKTEPELINNASDRLLTKLADGSWGFTINVTSVDVGAGSLVKKDTLVVPAATPQGYSRSFATADFTGGLDPESNTDLLERLQQGVAAKAPSNRINMQAMLRTVEAFSRVVHSAIVGHGDVEMLRDQHTIWPGSLGGRADWYVRTQERVLQCTMRLTATLLSLDNDSHGTWQAAIGRDAAPGFYEITSVRPVDFDNVLGTLPIVSDTRGLDLTGAGFVPDIVTIAEGAYSRYQTSVVQFTDTLSDQVGLVAGAQRPYDITVSMMPLIGQIQDYVGSYDVRSYGADVMVKAPVPCFVRLSFLIAKKRTQDDPDVVAIKDALCRRANTVDFVGRLYAGELQDVVHGFLPDGMNAGAIDMFGRVRWPDGSEHFVRSDDVLVVSGTDGSMVSDRTVQFFLDPESIAIDVRTDVPVPA